MARSAAARAASRYATATGIRQDHGARGAAISSVRDYYAGRDFYGRGGSRYERYGRYDPSSYGMDDFYGEPYGRRNEYGPRRDDYGIGFRDRRSSYGRRDEFGPSYGFRDDYGPYDRSGRYGRPGQYGRREDFGIGFRDAYGPMTYGPECDEYGCYDDYGPGMGMRGMGMRGGMDMPYGRYDGY